MISKASLFKFRQDRLSCAQEAHPLFGRTSQCHCGGTSVVFPGSERARDDRREAATRGALLFVMDDRPFTTRTTILVADFEEDANKCEGATRAMRAFGIEVDWM
jgi:hypothetical protein